MKKHGQYQNDRVTQDSFRDHLNVMAMKPRSPFSDLGLYGGRDFKLYLKQCTTCPNEFVQRKSLLYEFPFRTYRNAQTQTRISLSLIRFHSLLLRRYLLVFPLFADILQLHGLLSVPLNTVALVWQMQGCVTLN